MVYMLTIYIMQNVACLNGFYSRVCCAFFFPLEVLVHLAQPFMIPLTIPSPLFGFLFRNPELGRRYLQLEFSPLVFDSCGGQLYVQYIIHFVSGNWRIRRVRIEKDEEKRDG